MAVYKGHRVALLGEGNHSLVHCVDRVWNSFDVRMCCGMPAIISEVTMCSITDEPPTCLWCVANTKRYFLGGFE